MSGAVPVQLPLRIGLMDGATFENFLPGDNGELLRLLQRGSEPVVFLWGEAGSGKSHLLQAACRLARGAAYLPLAELSGESPELCQGLEQLELVALDEVEAVAGHADWETALFHLFNRCRQSGCRLRAAAAGPPSSLALSLPDLASRLAWGPVYQVHRLSDEQKRAALRLRAERRGMALPEEVTDYLLRRYSRDPHALFELLERLDRASLAAKRRLTVPFVRDLIRREGWV